MKSIQTPTSQEQSPLVAWRALLQSASRHPWLAALLGRHGAHIFNRFIHAYRQLLALPRRARLALQARMRRAHGRLAATILGLALLLAFSPIPNAQAATITVEPGCTLPQAIITANDGSAQGSCVSGDPGADTITLTGDVNLSDQLPAITSEITIEGNGHTITGSGANRVFEVNYGELTLNNAIVTGGAVDLDTDLDVYFRVGGALFNYEGTVTINDSTIAGNSALYGGALFNVSGDMTLNRSTISGNQAHEMENYGGEGGGIAMVDGNLEINNSTISGNEAYRSGAGIISLTSSGQLIVNNSTITDNVNEYNLGAGIHLVAGTATLNRAIVSGNSVFRIDGGAEDGSEIYVGLGTIYANNYNVFGYYNNARSLGFTPGVNDIVPSGPLTDILDITLQDNGGPTFTHALVSGSPAIDVAPDTDCTAAPISGDDQRSESRNANGDGAPSTNECDAGAFELQDPPTAIQLQSIVAQSRPAGMVAVLTTLLTTATLTLATAFRTLTRRRA